MLYEEDRFNPVNREECQEEARIRQNKLAEINTAYDKGYLHVSVFDKTKKKYVKIGLFSSGHQGNIIRHAVSGKKYYTHLVGTKSEDMFFKVSISTNTGTKTNNSTPAIFFFDSPEEYETCMHCKISDATKEKWLYKKSVM